jgi:prepilin signal peptidase PulO-like enzyme (type II secretory pathway)
MMDVSPFDEWWCRLLIGAVVGLALGSFVTMLSYRLPRRLSLTKPSRSFCPSCKKLLATRDLVPVVSWVVQSGKCRYCRRKISVRYPLIELATSVATMAAFGWIGFQPMLIAVLAGIITVITAVTITLER